MYSAVSAELVLRDGLSEQVAQQHADIFCENARLEQEISQLKVPFSVCIGTVIARGCNHSGCSGMHVTWKYPAGASLPQCTHVVALLGDSMERWKVVVCEVDIASCPLGWGLSHDVKAWAGYMATMHVCDWSNCFATVSF